MTQPDQPLPTLVPSTAAVDAAASAFYGEFVKVADPNAVAWENLEAFAKLHYRKIALSVLRGASEAIVPDVLDHVAANAKVYGVRGDAVEDLTIATFSLRMSQSDLIF